MRGKVCRILRKMTRFDPHEDREYVEVGTKVAAFVGMDAKGEPRFMQRTMIQNKTGARAVYKAAKLSYRDMEH